MGGDLLWAQLAVREGKLPGRLVSPGKDSGLLCLGWAHPEPLQARAQEALRLLDVQAWLLGEE